MEKLNYLNNFDLYEVGTLTSQIGDAIYAPSFISEIIIENEFTLSDNHTLYYCNLINAIHDNITVSVLIKNYEDHSILINSLLKSGVSVLSEQKEPILEPIKKSKKAKKKYKELRIEPKPKKDNFMKQLLNRILNN